MATRKRIAARPLKNERYTLPRIPSHDLLLKNIPTSLYMSPPSNKAAATKQRILKAANQLFYVHGYNATGLDAIINQAGITKGNFYYYFKSKEILATAVLEWHFEQITKETQDLLQAKNLTPLSTLFAILDAIEARQFSQYGEGAVCGCFVGNFTLEMSTDSEQVRAKVNSIFKRYLENFSNLLEQAKTTGEIPKSINPDEEASMILSLVEGALLLDKANQRPKAITQAIKFIKTHLDP